jgi:hypothetical protein
MRDLTGLRDGINLGLFSTGIFQHKEKQDGKRKELEAVNGRRVLQDDRQTEGSGQIVGRDRRRSKQEEGQANAAE